MLSYRYKRIIVAYTLDYNAPKICAFFFINFGFIVDYTLYSIPSTINHAFIVQYRHRIPLLLHSKTFAFRLLLGTFTAKLPKSSLH